MERLTALLTAFFLFIIRLGEVSDVLRTAKLVQVLVDFLQLLDELGDKILEAGVDVDIGVLVIDTQDNVPNAVFLTQLRILNERKLTKINWFRIPKLCALFLDLCLAFASQFIVPEDKNGLVGRSIKVSQPFFLHGCNKLQVVSIVLHLVLDLA